MSETSHSISTASGSKSAKPAGRSWRRVIVLGIVAAVVVGATGGVVRALRKSGGNVLSIPTVKVTRGPMLVSVTESGEIKAE